LVVFVVNYYCQYHQLKELNTLAIFIKIFSMETEQASGFDIFNLLHRFNNEKSLEMLTQHQADSCYQVVMMDLPVYKLEI
jgi:hypothetical protein